MKYYNKILNYVFIFLIVLVSTYALHPDEVFYTPFNVDQDDVITPLSGNLVGASQVTGYIGNAYEFEGEGSVDYIKFTDQEPINITGQALTFGAWVKTYGQASERQKVIQKLNANAKQGFSLSCETNEKSRCIIGNGTHVLSAETPNAVCTHNQWIHLYCTFDGSNIRIYVNGELDKTQAVGLTNVYKSETDLYIGAEDNNDDEFNGTIDEVHFFERVLNSTEMYNMYLYNNIHNTTCKGDTFTVGWYNSNSTITNYYGYNQTMAFYEWEDCNNYNLTGYEHRFVNYANESHHDIHEINENIGEIKELINMIPTIMIWLATSIGGIWLIMNGKKLAGLVLFAMSFAFDIILNAYYIDKYSVLVSSNSVNGVLYGLFMYFMVLWLIAKVIIGIDISMKLRGKNGI